MNYLTLHKVLEPGVLGDSKISYNLFKDASDESINNFLDVELPAAAGSLPVLVFKRIFRLLEVLHKDSLTVSRAEKLAGKFPCTVSYGYLLQYAKRNLITENVFFSMYETFLNKETYRFPDATVDDVWERTEEDVTFNSFLLSTNFNEEHFNLTYTVLSKENANKIFKFNASAFAAYDEDKVIPSLVYDALLNLEDNSFVFNYSLYKRPDIPKVLAVEHFNFFLKRIYDTSADAASIYMACLLSLAVGGKLTTVELKKIDNLLAAPPDCVAELPSSDLDLIKYNNYISITRQVVEDLKRKQVKAAADVYLQSHPEDAATVKSMVDSDSFLCWFEEFSALLEQIHVDARNIKVNPSAVVFNGKKENAK